MGRSASAAAARPTAGKTRRRKAATTPAAVPAGDDGAPARPPELVVALDRAISPQVACPQRLAGIAALGATTVRAIPFDTRPDAPWLVRDFDGEGAVRRLADACAASGLGLCLDVVLDRLAVDGPAAREAGALFAPAVDGDIVDPRVPPAIAAAALARGGAEALAEWWVPLLRRLHRAGAATLCLHGLDRLPPRTVGLIAGALRRDTTVGLWAWTPGVRRERLADLAGAALDRVFASTAWWDGRAAWYPEELEALARIASPLGVVDSGRAGAGREARRHLALAAATTDGLCLGEATARQLAPDLAEAACWQVPGFVTRAVRCLPGGSGGVTALARLDHADPRRAGRGLVTLVNGDRETAQPLPVCLDPLDPAVEAVLGRPRAVRGGAVPERLSPADICVVEVSALAPPRPDHGPEKGLGSPALAAARSPVVIDRVTPQVAGFAARRVVGQPVDVEADIFADGHDLLAADLLWRRAGDGDWQRVAMTPLGNDRWRGRFLPRGIGRHVFAIEAWRDEFGSLSHALEVRHRAGLPVGIDIDDAVACLRRLGLADAIPAAPPPAEAELVERLLAPALRRAAAARADRTRAARHPEIALEVERPQAACASWYELFPRSFGGFDDVIAELPRISAMGFDVLYFPPIHPIGTTSRKGRNNALAAAQGDPGSPYAIGAADGGHDAIHAELGTPQDFRRLVDAAADHGLEIALDFAIQCSPDHPWLRQHPEWFRRRADGSIRTAENPPKKYEDIVNVDFYADGAIPGLWLALRDIVLHWIGQGVRIFRVDNPHTKPLPFWEWMIADVRARHPEAIFLAEAFTRPAMMYRLGKIGFSQSYTYFTWRNTKRELVDYMVELATTEVAEFYRPHFFVNTPDINPYFLQGSGRAGFLIRAALAATLSGLWGMYSGFELCEAAALPGREEYLDSEKYEVRRRDYAAPGNIVSEIALLNRLRRRHPALRSHLGVRFYNAFNDQVMVYGKRAPGAEEMILVAVSLDPHAAQESDFEVPLWEWRLADDGAVETEDLVRGGRGAWRGKVQRLRLDPADLPFAIWRLAPPGRLA